MDLFRETRIDHKVYETVNFAIHEIATFGLFFDYTKLLRDW